MIRRIWLAGCLAAALLCDVPVVGARESELFDRRPPELARESGRGSVELRHWGGPTTHSNWWTPTYVRPGGYHRVPSHNVYNIYYFAPFSYPYINSGFGWPY